MAFDASSRQPMKRTPINPVSKKRRSQLTERAQTRRIVLGRVESCEAGIEGLCTYVPTDVHEIKTRARGGSITDPDNCLALCRNCHTFITDNPAWALEHGFVVHALATRGDMVAATRARDLWSDENEFAEEYAEEDVEEDS